MKIRMTKTMDGAPEGTLVHRYVEGTEHDLSHSPRQRELAAVFVREGWAVEVGAAPVAGPTEAGPLERLPLLEEYVAHGYKAEDYEAFIKVRTQHAKEAGRTVVVRALTPDELAEKKAQEDLELAARKAAEDARPAAVATAEEQPPPTAPASPKAEKRKGK